jgi:cell division protein FtsQ
MARNQGPFNPDDESMPVSRSDDERGNGAPYRRGNRRAGADLDEPDADRFAALGEEDDEGQQFRRAPRRVPVRRGPVTKKTAQRLRLILLVLIAIGAISAVWVYLYSYGQHSWRFRIESSDNIVITGNKHVTRSQIMRVMGGDIGRNVFFIPLADRKRQLEEIPWVESASVMRFLPNHIRVDIRERVPVAYVQFGSRVELIDANGVIMNLPTGGKSNWSFPVMTGMADSEPLSTRAPRMKKYMQLIQELDSSGARYSEDLNEVDVSDPEDVKVTVAESGRSIAIHLGSSDFLERYKIFKTHVQEWMQQYQNLQSVDLRYDRQVILNPDSRTGQSARVETGGAASSTPKKVRRRP